MVCQSVLHFVEDCLDAYKNIKQTFTTEAEEFALFTGKSKNELTVLLIEATNSAVLDSACFSTVAGKAG